MALHPQQSPGRLGNARAGVGGARSWRVTQRAPRGAAGGACGTAGGRQVVPSSDGTSKSAPGLATRAAAAKALARERPCPWVALKHVDLRQAAAPSRGQSSALRGRLVAARSGGHQDEQVCNVERKPQLSRGHECSPSAHGTDKMQGHNVCVARRADGTLAGATVLQALVALSASGQRCRMRRHTSARRYDGKTQTVPAISSTRQSASRAPPRRRRLRRSGWSAWPLLPGPSRTPLGGRDGRPEPRLQLTPQHP